MAYEFRKNDEWVSLFKHFDNSDCLIKVVSIDFQPIYLSQSWSDLNGCAIESGERWLGSVHSEDINRINAAYREQLNTPKKFVISYQFRRADGIIRWIRETVRPRFDLKQEKCMGFICSGMDITDLHDQMQELEKSVRTREDFISFASHELKSPLTSLNLQMNLLERSLQRFKDHSFDKRSVSEMIKIGERQLQKLNELVEKLLDFSRMSYGRLQLDMKKINLSEMLGQISERFELTCNSAGCSLQKSIIPNIYVNGDPTRIDQVITNLLSNAAKYGAGKPVTLCLDFNKGQAVIRVKDQGIGISKLNQEHLFEKFYRCAPSEIGGLGLGLYISKKIIDAHKGTIKFQSELGLGSEFSIELPAMIFEKSNSDENKAS